MFLFTVLFLFLSPFLPLFLTANYNLQMFLFTVLFLFLSPVKSARTGKLTRPVQMIWILWNDVLVRKQMHYVNIMRQIVA